MNAPYRHLGELRDVKLIVYQNNRRVESAEWDEELWVESADDMLALLTPLYQNKRVRVVRKDDWKKAPIILEPNLKCPICGKINCKGECDEDRYLHLIWDRDETF